MFQHLLVPTDGSPLAETSARKAVAFAKEVGARVTALSVKLSLIHISEPTRPY